MEKNGQKTGKGPCVWFSKGKFSNSELAPPPGVPRAPTSPRGFFPSPPARPSPAQRGPPLPPPSWAAPHARVCDHADCVRVNCAQCRSLVDGHGFRGPCIHSLQNAGTCCFREHPAGAGTGRAMQTLPPRRQLEFPVGTGGRKYLTSAVHTPSHSQKCSD